MITTMDGTTTLAEALAANLVADRARRADYADGSRCEVCRRYVQGGERIADLAGGGLVHVSRCSPTVRPVGAAGRRGSSRSSSSPAAQLSPAAPARGASSPAST